MRPPQRAAPQPAPRVRAQMTVARTARASDVASRLGIDVSTADACGTHIADPSTSVPAFRHTTGTRARHGAHHPCGSAAGRPTADVMPRSSPQRDHACMPWSNSRPRSRRYGRQHRADRERHMRELEQQGAGLCAERVCLYRTRVITPDMSLHLAHDPTGTVVIGLAHARCNTHEASVRARRIQTTRPRPDQRPRTDPTW